MLGSPRIEDDRQGFDLVRKSEIVKLLRANGAKFNPASTKAELVKIAQGAAIQNAVPAPVVSRLPAVSDLDLVAQRKADIAALRDMGVLKARGVIRKMGIDVQMTDTMNELVAKVEAKWDSE